MWKRLLLVVDALLIALAVWLGTQLYTAWRAAPKPAAAPGATAAAPAAASPGDPAPTPAPASPLSAFAVVADRNLFNPNRTEAPPEPPKPAAPGATAPAAPPAPKPRLYGVVLGGEDGGRAYLEDPRTRKVFAYAIGDSVAESRVERIDADRVVMRRGGETFEVLLRDPSKPRPPPVPAPGAQPGVPPAAQPVPGAPPGAPAGQPGQPLFGVPAPVPGAPPPAGTPTAPPGLFGAPAPGTPQAPAQGFFGAPPGQEGAPAPAPGGRGTLQPGTGQRSPTFRPPARSQGQNPFAPARPEAETDSGDDG